MGRSRYFWVVLCKNHWFHVRKNLFFRHKILLGETDAITPRPAIDQRFKVRCDECGKEYTYKSSEVLRVEQEPPEGFTPHPLFREELALDDANRSTEREPRQEKPPQEGQPQAKALQEESPQKEPPQDEQTRAKGA